MTTDVPTPRVSVIVPTHNRATLLTESLDSVLAQDVASLELIVVDDGSTDDTPQLLAAYADRLVALRQTNQGVAAATMAGIYQAKSPLIALHDSDDRMLSGRLQKQCDFLDANPSVMAVAGNMVFEGNEQTNYLQSIGIEFDEHGEAIFERPYERVVARNFMANAASCFRREAFLTAGGYDLSYRAVQDGEFWFRVARKWSLACLNHPCTWVRVHNGSLSQSTAALECKLRLYEREIASGDLRTPSIRALIIRRLRYLTREYVRRCSQSGCSDNWRELARQVARHVSLVDRLRLELGTRLPTGLVNWVC
ncbi:MAG: glycosyltransferase family 2 protein [Planctomycetales bacterium]|nr:glycosyltransferase family 2 protein [Planctomycetales bacterium]